MSDKIAKAGSLVIVESGSYSSYQIWGVFRVSRDFELPGVLEQYLEDRPEQRHPYEFEDAEFLAFLLAERLLIELRHGTLQLGEYSAGELEFYPAKDDKEG
jgi:hypothetical protein